MDQLNDLSKELMNLEDLSLMDIHNKILELDNEITAKTYFRDQYKNIYNKLLILQIKNNHKFVWTIQAIPSKPISPIKNACNFISYSEALKHMPKNNSTFDYDCSCRWTYSIIETSVDTLSDDEILNIGKVPIDYPYYGW